MHDQDLYRSTNDPHVARRDWLRGRVYGPAPDLESWGMGRYGE